MGQESVPLEQVIAIARGLDPAERLKLRQALDQMITEVPVGPPETTFKRLLYEKCLISEIRLPPRADDPRMARRPVPVEGKPVSETIIEDRG